jgi:dTDP-L-rhamnose 4-epimerase
MGSHILITGGAGFIGSHLADALLERGHRVRVLDALVPQVHGPERQRPTYLAPEVELLVGDVRDEQAIRRALDGVDVVVHLAAAVGVGQSMYEIVRYTEANTLATAVLLEALSQRPVARLLVASSMSVYGEGAYRRRDGTPAVVTERSLAQLKAAQWEPRGADGEAVMPVATPESKPPSLASVYALSKYDQERLCLLVGRAYGIPTTALRLFNVYGPRQALSNPYTGVLAIFASRLLNGNAPTAYEDGLQRRDFVSVHDVAAAFRLALDAPGADGCVLNVGSGRSYSIREIAERVAAAVGRAELRPLITGKYRVGDIRHCFADISEARRLIGYEPAVTLEAGLVELADWLVGQEATDRADEAGAELAARGLTV